MPTLDFKGKQFIYGHHLTIPVRPLQIDANKSLTGDNDPSLNDNLIIHGDNLHALKALLPKYAGRIKCIYIDPPYNTGNENWGYNDNVNSPMMQAWLEKHSPVDVEDLERHDKWLCMMWPRLHLLHELLSDDGVIFISIDDNEQHHLRMLMDEVFGGKNFVAAIIVRSNPGGRDYGGIAHTHDYVVVYRKTLETDLNSISVEVESSLPLVDAEGRFKVRELRNRNIRFNNLNRPNLYYPIYVNPDEPDENDLCKISLIKMEGWVEVFPLESQGVKTVWRWQQETVLQNLNRNVMGKKKRDGNFQIVEKYRKDTKRERSILSDKDFRNERGTLTLKTIFGGQSLFDYPKSDLLIKRLIELGTDKDSIVLDSFAGSGTTAHAVLALNKENGGNRKFILIECEDYADTITAERVRRVINGVENATNENLRDGLDGSFTYCTLGEPIDEEGMLTGENLPTYEALAHYIAYTATGSALTLIKKQKDYCFGETNDIRFYLIYEPTLEFLESNKSALDGERAERIAKVCKETGKSAYVYAPQKFVSQKELTSMGITFCQLPYNIHRITE